MTGCRNGIKENSVSAQNVAKVQPDTQLVAEPFR